MGLNLLKKGFLKKEFLKVGFLKEELLKTGFQKNKFRREEFRMVQQKLLNQFNLPEKPAFWPRDKSVVEYERGQLLEKYLAQFRKGKTLPKKGDRKIGKPIFLGKLEMKIGRQSCTIFIYAPVSFHILVKDQLNEPEQITAFLINWGPINIKVPVHGPKEPSLLSSSYEARVAYNEANIKFLSRAREALEKIQAKKNEIVAAFGKHHFYLYKTNLYCFDESDNYTPEERLLLIKSRYYKEEVRFTKLQKEVRLFEKLESMELHQPREPIPEDVKFAVWRRDQGRCVQCGSNENLEFDHIIPVSKGGSNTERNLQLLCVKCNREKSNKI